MNPFAAGRAIFEAASTVGLKTSVATVNRIAGEMNFKSVFTRKQEKLTALQKAYRVKFCRRVQEWDGYLGFLPMRRCWCSILKKTENTCDNGCGC